MAAFESSFIKLYAKREWNFAAIWFPSDMHLSFGIAEKDADFSCATFNGPIDFRTTRFKGKADFSNAVFNARADFGGAVFESGAFFHGASFNAEVEFRSTSFYERAGFSGVTFNDRVWFTDDLGDRGLRDHARLDLSYARIENPERFSFRNVTLRPNWFVNVNSSRFDFIDVNWNWGTINEEIASLRTHRLVPETVLLARACWNLADNAEENHRYGEASRFRYRAMDVTRQSYARGLGFWKLNWWYWQVSGYGERIWKAFATLLLIWVGFALAYMGTGHIKLPELTQYRNYLKEFVVALNYSLQVLTFQKPDKPAGFLTSLLVSFEMILGPVQAALLALAIRRKFMR